MGKGQILYSRARKLIPGGTQLLSKRPEMFLPEQWPAYYSRAKGVEVWDMDGQRYLDMSYNGLGACILGAADPDVDAAVRAAIDAGSMSTLNAPEEVELAELLCRLHPWANMVRYARCGGEAMAIAVRIARAYTQRDRIAFCGYHGWHDWYLAANLASDSALDGHLLPGLQPAGVPRGLLGTALPFHYNKIAELEAITTKYRSELAAIVLEPLRNVEPKDGFLDKVRQIAAKIGAVLVIDEVSAGFRLTTGGAHLCYGIAPDIAVFAKGISNGYPMAAVIGRGEVMQAAQDSFISSTYWTDRIGPAAALATIRKHERLKVATHLVEIGNCVKIGWAEAGHRVGFNLTVDGIAPMAHFTFPGPTTLLLKTLFIQLMLERGFLATTGFYAAYAHTPKHVADYLAATNEVFHILAADQKTGKLESRLKGPVCHAGFTRLT